jgi:hypothetical protein
MRRTTLEHIIGLGGFLISWLFLFTIALSPPL